REQNISTTPADVAEKGQQIHGFRPITLHCVRRRSYGDITPPLPKLNSIAFSSVATRRTPLGNSTHSSSPERRKNQRLTRPLPFPSAVRQRIGRFSPSALRVEFSAGRMMIASGSAGQTASTPGNESVRSSIASVVVSRPITSGSSAPGTNCGGGGPCHCVVGDAG